MGIFKKIKQYFSSDITPDVSKLNGFVVPYPVKRGTIKMNSRVVVPNGYAFVLGHNGRALDAFREGEYFMAPAVLPECCKKLKIHKMDKKGNIKKKFKADLYFVDLKSYEFEFKSAKTEMGNRAMGIFSAGSEGKVVVSVKEPRDFVASLLGEFAYLRNGEAEKIIRNWISESVTEVFRKNNFALSELISINPMIEEKTKADIAMMLSKQGLILESFEFTNFVLPKKHQKQYLANKNKCEDVQKSLPEDDLEVVDEQKVEQTDDLNDQEIENIDKAKSDQENYMPFGNITIFENSETQIEDDKKLKEQTDNKVLEQQIEVEAQESFETQETKAQSEETESAEFVDLNIDNIIKNKDNGKRCLKCGTVNDFDEPKCTLCGNKF